MCVSVLRSAAGYAVHIHCPFCFDSVSYFENNIANEMEHANSTNLKQNYK